LTFRSAVTGSGVVVDVDLGEGVTLFGVQPVLHAAVSLKKFIFSFTYLILFEFISNLTKRLKSV
jgi:hypothetical protein